jgi:hypothetical protein
MVAAQDGRQSVPGHGLLSAGNFFFSDLTHYVRRDSVLALSPRFKDLDGYAFAPEPRSLRLERRNDLIDKAPAKLLSTVVRASRL